MYRNVVVRQIDRAVSDVLQPRPAPLLFIGLVEVVTRDDVVTAREPRRDRVAIEVVVGGPLRQPRDLLVRRPASGPVAMRIGLRFRDGAVVRGSEMDARIVVGRGAAGARFGAELLRAVVERRSTGGLARLCRDDARRLRAEDEEGEDGDADPQPAITERPPHELED